MGLRSSAEFKEGLRDKRRIVYRGELVEDVTSHEALGRTVDHAAGLFDERDAGPVGLWAYEEPALDGEICSAFWRRPTDAAELARRGDLIEAATSRSRSTFNIIQAVGSDVLFGLEQVMADREDPTYAQRIEAFRLRCAAGDLGVALAATDAKGDRSLRPAEQPDPDLYLRVVDRDAEGIVVRGAKAHTTASPAADEIVCIPCRAMTEADSDYAVAFAIPPETPGLTLIAHPFPGAPPAEQPISDRNIEVETLTVFDDVRVPWERVFLCGEAELAGPVAAAFANFHRFTAISYKPPSLEVMIGAAALVIDQLGLQRSTGAREKLGQLIVYVELVRTARLAAAHRSRVDRCGLAIPDSIANNAGKYHFSSGFHQAVALLQDLAGGLLVTAPGAEDMAHPEVGPVLEKYLAGRAGVGGRERWALLQVIRDLTASEFGGWTQVATLHGEGSGSAQLMQVVRDYDLRRSTGLVQELMTEVDQSLQQAAPAGG